MLVQGASGGVATALIVLASAAGDPRVGHRPLRGASASRPLELGRRPGVRVRRAAARARRRRDGDRSARRPGGTRSGRSSPAARSSSPAPPPATPRPAELTRVFFLQLSVVGSTMGTREELERLMRLCVDRDIRPVIDGDDAARRGASGLRGDARRRRRRQDRLHGLSVRGDVHLQVELGSHAECVERGARLLQGVGIVERRVPAARPCARSPRRRGRTSARPPRLSSTIRAPLRIAT